MGAPKGSRNNPNGRPKGSKSQKTLDWEEFGQLLLNAGLPRMLDMVRAGSDDDVLKIMLPMIEYFKPKLARTETHNTNDNKLTIEINWEKPDANRIDYTSATALESGSGPDGTQAIQRPEMRPPVR